MCNPAEGKKRVEDWEYYWMFHFRWLANRLQVYVSEQRDLFSEIYDSLPAFNCQKIPYLLPSALPEIVDSPRVQGAAPGDCDSVHFTQCYCSNVDTFQAEDQTWILSRLVIRFILHITKSIHRVLS